MKQLIQFKIGLVALLAVTLLGFTACETTSGNSVKENSVLRNGNSISWATGDYNSSPVFKSGKVPSAPEAMVFEGGKASVEFVVNADGKTESIKVLSTTVKHFGGNIAYAVRFWRFEPAMKDGNAVACKGVTSWSSESVFSDNMNGDRPSGE